MAKFDFRFRIFALQKRRKEIGLMSQMASGERFVGNGRLLTTYVKGSIKNVL
jgi:hypothetical protein